MFVQPRSSPQDLAYIKKWYTIEFDEKSAITNVGGRDDSGRVTRAKADFNP
jgi:hypothetical protein